MQEYQQGELMNKIVYFGVNTTALNILKRINLSKDLLVTINADKATNLKVTDYNIDLLNLDFSNIYHVEKYSLKSETDENFFKSYNGDIGIVIGWNRLIPLNIIKTFKYGIVGFHGTPYGLPKGRGRSPVIWSIVLGEKKYHFYLFQLTEGVDDGPIYSEKIIDINSFDTIVSFNEKIAIVAAEMLNEVVPKIFNGKVQPVHQEEGDTTYFPKRNFNDGKIFWDKTSEEICNLIRAITEPYPCAHTHINDKVVKILDAQPFSSNLFLKKNPGEICTVFDNGHVIVRTGDGTLLIKKYEADCRLEGNQTLIF